MASISTLQDFMTVFIFNRLKQVIINFLIGLRLILTSLAHMLVLMKRKSRQCAEMLNILIKMIISTLVKE